MDIATILKYAIPFALGVIFSTNVGLKMKRIMARNSLTNFVYNICLMTLFILCIIITIGKGYSAPLYAGF